MIFDEEYSNSVSKDEFVNGMFRLIFNDEFQRGCCLLMTIAQVKKEVTDLKESQSYGGVGGGDCSTKVKETIPIARPGRLHL